MSQMRTRPRGPGEQARLRAGAGATWGDFNYATHAFGLSTTGGIISTTGIFGSHTGRRHRLPGPRLRADDRQPDLSQPGYRRREIPYRERARRMSDLFWGLRGWGGNFGVVTSLEYRLHEVDRDLSPGRSSTTWRTAATVLRMLPTNSSQDAPEQFGGFPGFQIAPPLPFIPENRHGDTLCPGGGALGLADRPSGESPQALPGCGSDRGRRERARCHIRPPERRLRRPLIPKGLRGLLERLLRQGPPRTLRSRHTSSMDPRCPR